MGLWYDLSILKIPGGRVARKIAQRLRALDFLIEDSGVCCGGWSAEYPRSPFSCSGWSASVRGGSHQSVFRDAHLLSVCDAEEKNRVPQTSILCLRNALPDTERYSWGLDNKFSSKGFQG